MRDQIAEELELFGRQANLSAARADLSRIEIVDLMKATGRG